MEERKEKMTLREVIDPEAPQNFPQKLEEMVRPRIAATVDEKVSTDIKRIHNLEKELAQRGDRPEPKVSHTIELLLRKGIKTYNSEKK